MKTGHYTQARNNHQGRFASFQEFVRAFGKDGADLIVKNLPGLKVDDFEELTSKLPNVIPRESLEDLSRIVGSKISHIPDKLKRVLKGIKPLAQKAEFTAAPKVLDQILRHSEIIYVPSKSNLKEVRPNIVVGDSFNRPEAKTHSHKLLWLTRLMYDQFDFKDIMLPNIGIHFFNTGTNSGVVANGGFMAFDFLDLGNANKANNREFIRNTLLGDREVRKLLDIAKVKVVYDNEGIRIFISLPKAEELYDYGVNMSKKELSRLKQDLKQTLLNLNGKPAVRFKALTSSLTTGHRVKLPLDLLMGLDARSILEEITQEMPEHLKPRIFNDCHWFTDPQKNSLLLHYEHKNSPNADRNLESSEILTVVKQYNPYPELKIKLISDLDHREYSLYLDSLENTATTEQTEPIDEIT